PGYLNAVAQVATLLSPRATLNRLHAIEEAMGRMRRERWGSREIDLDLLLFGDKVIDQTGLQVPHPLLATRAFVLEPLCELAPVDRLKDQLKDRPKSFEVASALGNLYYDNGRYLEAVDALRQAEDLAAPVEAEADALRKQGVKPAADLPGDCRRSGADRGLA